MIPVVREGPDSRVLQKDQGNRAHPKGLDSRVHRGSQDPRDLRTDRAAQYLQLIQESLDQRLQAAPQIPDSRGIRD